MLAARHRQDHRRSPLYCFCQGMICGCITGMKRHHHIHMAAPFIGCDISLIKMQFFVMIFFCKTAACLDDISLQIQTDHLDIITFQLMQIVIHCKCKVGFTAPKINDIHLSVFWKPGENILNKLQKAVELLKFIITGILDPARFIHNSQIYQIGHRHTFLQQIFLLPVVGQHGNKILPALCFLSLNCKSALFTGKNCTLNALCLQLKLAEILLHPVVCETEHFLSFMVFMKLFLSHSPCNLIHDPALQQ